MSTEALLVALILSRLGSIDSDSILPKFSNPARIHERGECEYLFWPMQCLS
jgi:hypothetical protein